MRGVGTLVFALAVLVNFSVSIILPWREFKNELTPPSCLPGFFYFPGGRGEVRVDEEDHPIRTVIRNGFYIGWYGPGGNIKSFFNGSGKQIKRDVEGGMPLEMTPRQALKIGIGSYYPHPPPEFRDPIPENQGTHLRSSSPVRRFSGDEH